MTQDRLDLDRLLAASNMPPGVALDAAARIARRIARTGPMGAYALRPAGLRLGADGEIKPKDAPAPGSSPSGDARALGALLYEFLTGVRWSDDAGLKDRQLAGLRRSLQASPVAGEVVDLITDLQTADRARLSFEDLARRADTLRTQTSDPGLDAWAHTVLGTPQPLAARPVQTKVASPDVSTGVFPPGMLASLIGEAAARDATDPRPPEPPGDTPAPKSGENLDDLDAVLKRLAKEPAVVTPAPAPNTQKPKPPPKPPAPAPASPGLWIWLVAGGLLLLIIALLAALLLLS